MLIMCISFLHTLQAQELQSTLFNDVNKIRLNAIVVHANVLSPKAFEDAVKAYDKAVEGYLEDGNLADIKENIDVSYSKFTDAIENAKINAVMFSAALAARDDAMNAEAHKVNITHWNNAEQLMRDAAKDFEKGNANNAKEKVDKAVTLYRSAELESIKTYYLANAKKMIAKAEDDKVGKNAPKTLDQAELLISNAEKILAEDRYDTDEARHMAKEAEYKASLARHISSQVEILDDKDFEAEDYLLMAYDPLANIGENLDIYLRFDQGITQPLSQILSKVGEYKTQILNLENELYSLKEQNRSYEQILAEQKEIQKNLKDQLSDEAVMSLKKLEYLEAKINENTIFEGKFDEIQRLFNSTEAQVFRQKNDVIIRMVGVNFDVGKSLINKENYGTISKIEKAADIFENATITIEGHTDSKGSDETNMELSKARAGAVLSYLLASSKIDASRVETMGYGENRPVSNNETALGRTHNRRIDFVIRPIAQNNPEKGLK